MTPLQTGSRRTGCNDRRARLRARCTIAGRSRGGPLVQTIISSPVTGASTVRAMYCLSIVCAQQVDHIANPYFVPDPAAIER